MAHTEKVYILTSRAAGILMAYDHELKCHVCEEPLLIGQTIVRKRRCGSNGYGKSRLYHKSCWEDLFV